MLRSDIILTVGAALLISWIVISVLWAMPLAGTTLREYTILSGVLVRPAASVNTYTQVIDTSHPVSLVIHVMLGNRTSTATTTGGQIIPNNILKETVINPNGIIMTSNNFTKQFFTTFKPDITGKYTLTIYNLGHTPVSVGVLVGNSPFVGSSNQTNLNSLSGIITSISIAGIIVLIAGIIVLILDRRIIRPKVHTPI
jgi:hypothetical protein